MSISGKRVGGAHELGDRRHQCRLFMPSSRLCEKCIASSGRCTQPPDRLSHPCFISNPQGRRHPVLMFPATLLSGRYLQPWTWRPIRALNGRRSCSSNHPGMAIRPVPPLYYQPLILSESLCKMPNDSVVVDVYTMDVFLHDEETFASMVADADRKKIKNFARPARRFQSISGRLLVREALRMRHGDDAATWQLAVNAQGKPYLVGDGAPEISLSHSHDLVACAVSEMAIGLDVEYLRERHFNDMAQLICTPDELRRFSALPEDERSKEFYRIWTFKEAAFKLLGRERGRPEICEGYGAVAADLRCTSFYPRNGFLGAVAAHADFSLAIHPTISSMSLVGG